MISYRRDERSSTHHIGMRPMRRARCRALSFLAESAGTGALSGFGGFGLFGRLPVPRQRRFKLMPLGPPERDTFRHVSIRERDLDHDPDRRSGRSAAAVSSRRQRGRNAVYRPAVVSTVGGATYRVVHYRSHAYARSRLRKHAVTGSPQRLPASGPMTNGAAARPW
jgi:hypothetical protein